MAGYFRGWVDEVIQYFYTVLSSVPNILLIAACVLMVQVFLDKHPDLFETGVERADVKLFLLCTVLGPDRLGRAVPAPARRDAEAARARLRAGRQRLRRQLDAHHVAPHLPQRRPPDADRHGARLLVADPLRSGPVVCRRGRRSVDEQLRRHDQPGPQGDEPRPGRVVELRRRVRLHGDAWCWPSTCFADGVRDAFDPRARAFRPRLPITRHPTRQSAAQKA